MERIANPPSPAKPAKKNPNNKAKTQVDAARAGELSRILSADPDLPAILTAWPDLPAAVRAGIVAMVNASKPATAARLAHDKPER